MNNTDIRNIKHFLYIVFISFLLLLVFNAVLVLVPLQREGAADTTGISYLEKDSPGFVTEEKIALSSVPDTLAVWSIREAEGQQRLPETTGFEMCSSLCVSGCSKITLYDTKTGKNTDYGLEEYVTGTLLAEMPTSYEAEALKAQAVACRTYAVYKLRSGICHDSGANLCTSAAHCQAFVSAENVTPERYEIARNAVKETENIIMFYDGQPILAVFHASCGKMTNSSEEVWGGARDYLQSVDTFESLNPDMETVKTYTFEKDDFLARIKRAGVEITDITNVYTTRNPSGKTVGLYVSDVFIKGESAANVLGLRSCDYEAVYDANNGVVSFTVYGYGHGVGLSQKGAQDLAQRGYRFYEILKHYYSGISFGYVQ